MIRDEEKEISVRKSLLPAAETEAVNLVATADSLEEAMAPAGYGGTAEALRANNEARFEARLKLGLLLAKMEKR